MDLTAMIITEQYGNKYLNNMMHVDTGEHWKAMRNAVAPVFTSGKIRCGFSSGGKDWIGGSAKI